MIGGTAIKWLRFGMALFFESVGIAADVDHRGAVQ